MVPAIVSTIRCTGSATLVLRTAPVGQFPVVILMRRVVVTDPLKRDHLEKLNTRSASLGNSLSVKKPRRFITEFTGGRRWSQS
jgi:hypothetical protein